MVSIVWRSGASSNASSSNGPLSDDRPVVLEGIRDVFDGLVLADFAVGLELTQVDQL